MKLLPILTLFNLSSCTKNEELELSDIDKYWNPKLYIENTMGEFKESVWHVVSYNSLGRLI